MNRIIEINEHKIGNTLKGVPIHSKDIIDKCRNPFIICSVGAKKANPLIKEALRKKELTEVEDFIFAA